MKREKAKTVGGKTIEILTPESEADYREIERLVAAGTCEIGGLAQPQLPQPQKRGKP